MNTASKITKKFNQIGDYEKTSSYFLLVPAISNRWRPDRGSSKTNNMCYYFCFAKNQQTVMKRVNLSANFSRSVHILKHLGLQNS